METYPKEITRDVDTSMDVASYDYYTGIRVAKERNLKQTTNFGDVFNNTHFIVCCGDVMIRVRHDEFPEINRRTI